MKVSYSKAFIKAIEKLSIDQKDTVSKIINQVKKAAVLSNIHNCRKLTAYKNVYRIRIGNYMAIFLFIILKDTVYFQYFLPRGETYNKEYLKNIK